jgi:hypothetical protein
MIAEFLIIASTRLPIVGITVRAACGRMINLITRG